MKKSVQKLLCALLCLVTAGSVAGCKYEVDAPESSHKASVDASQDNKEEETSSPAGSGNSQDGTNNSISSESDEETSDSGSETPDSGSENPDSSGENPDVDPPEQGGSGGLPDDIDPPDPEKELVLEDVDTFGHKIAYYSDGTWEDLGRVVPLDFIPRAAASRYGYTMLRMEENAAGKQNFYNQLFNAALHFYQAGGDVEAESVAGGVCYPIAKIDCSAYGISYETQQAVWRTFRQDCPEFYFISTQFCSAGDEFWLCIDGEYAKVDKRAELRSAIENAALECDAYLNGNMSDVEIALTVNDYLTANVTYSYQSDGVTPSDDVWAHNLVGWATKGEGVCETYAESYAYLCDLFGLECWTVTGNDLQSGVGHAWNILKLDGEWYNVDVTWNDEFENSTPQVLSRKWFGMSATAFASTHQADLSTAVALDYQVPLPTLSETELSPVRLQENGAWGTMLPNLDKALENMPNEGSMYEVILYPDTNAQAAAGKVIYPQGAMLTKTKIPKTAGVLITAKRYNVSANSYIPATLNVSSALELKGDLTLNDLTLTGSMVKAIDADLILTDGAELNVEALTAMMVCVDAKTGYAVINGALQVTQMDVISGSVRINGLADIQLLQMEKDTKLYHLTADNLTVGSVISEEDAMLYTTGKTSASVVTVGGIVARSPLTLQIVFVGVSGYPTLKLTGAIDGSLNLVVSGRVAENDATEITPTMMTVPVANVTSAVDTNALRVYFVKNNTAYEKSYTKDADGNLTANA